MIFGARRGLPKQAFLVMLILIMLSTAVPLTSQAQYFGRNKVQYEDFDFSILKTDHLRIYHYPPGNEVARDVSLMAERWYSRLSTLFGEELQEGQPVILYGNHADFQQTNVISGLISQGTGGVTEGLLNRVTLPLTGVYAEDNHVLGHELVHAFHYRIIKKNTRGLRTAGRLPLWFIEGMSEYLSIGSSYPLTDMWLRDAVLNEKVPTLDEMTGNRQYFPYRWGHAFWIYVAGQWGDNIIPTLFLNVLRGGWEKAFKAALQIEPEEFSRQWQQYIREAYRPTLEGRTVPDQVGIAVTSEETRMNLAPAVSPDGRYVAVISQRDLFTMDLYLVDLKTGETIDKLASSNADSHFDALRFIDAAGAFSPDGSRFAMAVFKDGDNGIALVDVADRDIQRTIKFEDVDAITHLAYSPDGSAIAFAGSEAGQSNLYLYNLEQDALEQLTQDRFAEIQPSFSPDGRRILFVTDRGPETDFERLVFGHMRLATYDLQSGQIETFAVFQRGKHISPHYSPDGEHIYFVSDRDGFSDIYRHRLSDGVTERITNVATGITGLSTLSPCLSIASETGELVFTVFDNTEYRLRTLDPEQTTPEPRDVAATGVGKLSPHEESYRVSSWMTDPEPATSFAGDFELTDYHPSLKLYYAGATNIGIAADRFGMGVGGSTNLYFTDMLGDHLLGISAQANGGFKDLGGQVFYQNRSNRLNWGAVAAHIPYRIAFVRAYTDTVTAGGGQVAVPGRELVLQRIYNDRLGLLTEYPLSTNRRFELAVGYSRIAYDFEAERAVYYNGYWHDRGTREIEAPSALNLAQGALAYVGDYSLIGFTSPVRGRRFRFEVESTLGTLNFMSVLADYRHYFHLNPFTFAVRGLHHGRYFGDSEDDRLSPLYLGLETLVRGYTAGSFNAAACGGVDDESCGEFNRLIGSRVGVMNFEVRYPLFGTSDYGLVDFSYLPTSLLAFFDAGVAWTESESPVFEWKTETTERVPVTSAGLGVRSNIMGYIVLQVYYAFPFQRPNEKDQWGFVIAPGW